MRYIIDRFEHEMAVLEDEEKKMIQISNKYLPKGAREGDVIILEHNVYTIDQDETKKRKENIKKMIDELWN